MIFRENIKNNYRSGRVGNDYWLRLLFILFLIMIAGESRADSLGAVLENDLFTGTDNHYTNGLRISWLGEPIGSKDTDKISKTWGKWLQSWLTPLSLTNSPNKKHSVAFSVSQSMVTPTDITIKELIPDDAPYAGHLGITSSYFIWDADSFEGFEFQLGIVGPSSLAEQAQKIVHSMIGSDEPMGWDNQLGDQLTAGIGYTYGRRLWNAEYVNGLQSDLVTTFGLQLGNFRTGIGLGGFYRIGHDFPDNFNFYYTGAGSESALLGTKRKSKDWGWSAGIGFVAEAIAHEYVIDNADRHNLTREPLVGKAVLVLSAYHENFQITYTVQDETPPAKESNEIESFGALSFIWHY